MRVIIFRLVIVIVILIMFVLLLGYNLYRLNTNQATPSTYIFIPIDLAMIALNGFNVLKYIEIIKVERRIANGIRHK